uniref:Immunoglobulin V-set domain-containing protein n=1 Tax=Sander lucioperca TaxID=283035 RepID=A0A8C9WYQ4_SANLU
MMTNRNESLQRPSLICVIRMLGNTGVGLPELERISTLNCPYESEYQNSLKYICRGNQPSVCLQHALISSDNKQKGQFTLTDDMASRKFTVTITSLSQNNSGSYLCGVHGNTGLDAFSAFELEVKGKRSTSSYYGEHSSIYDSENDCSCKLYKGLISAS